MNAGRVEAMWVKRAHRGPMDAVDEAQFIARRGLAGNADIGGRRQVTIIERGRWLEATAALGDVDPVLRRANVMVSGIDLEASRGRLLQVGDVILAIDGVPITTSEGGRRIANLDVGETVSLLIRRDGDEMDVNLVPVLGCNTPGISVRIPR